MSTPKLKRYNSKFEVIGGHLKLGGRTEVEILNLKTQTHQVDGERNMLVTALVEISAVVSLLHERAGCAICGVKAPEPGEQATQDDLWFILENHDGGRYVFPYPEDCEDERDRYPVQGWRKTAEGLTCDSCFRELKDAQEAVKARLKAKRAP